MNNLAFKKESIAKQLICHFNIIMKNCFADICRADRDLIQNMLGYFLYSKTKLGRHFFHQLIIPQSFPAKAMIITYNNCIGMKFFKKKIPDIIFSRLVGKRICKGNNNKMINAK